jgi:DoxX-like family
LIPEKNQDRKWVKTILTVPIACVWLINGLFCKVLNLVPRHQLIVARILGEEHAAILTKAIGISEILVFIWIVTGIKSRLCALTQIVLVATMNIIEYILAPDLLLFGRVNILLATVLVIIIFINEFVLNKPGKKLNRL